MPELPEVETIVQTLSPELRGAEIISFTLIFPGLLRNESPKALEKLRGKRIKNIRRRGKLALFDLENRLTLVFHLKMTGQLLLCNPSTSLDRHTHFVLAFRNLGLELRFRDMRKFGYVRCVQVDRIEEVLHLGPEPLEINLQEFKALFKGRRGGLKRLLLNQGFIAGIGNIYGDEILFEARLHPETPVCFLKDEELDRLWKAMRLVLESAISHRGSSIRDFKDPYGSDGEFQDLHKVYGKQSHLCPNCGKSIERLKIGGRSSFFCPQCQKKRVK